MDIIATRGDDIYLAVPDGIEGDNPDGFMVNLKSGLTFHMPIQEALKLGYWEEAPSLDAATRESVRIATERAITPEEFRAALTGAEKQATTYRNKYSVLQEGNEVGTLVFGGMPAIEITSQNDPLLEIVGHAMVNPIEVEDEDGGTIYSTLGDIQYEIAVTLLLERAGYRLVREE